MSIKRVMIRATKEFGDNSNGPSSYKQYPEFNGLRLPDWVRGLVKESYAAGKKEGKAQEFRRIRNKAVMVMEDEQMMKELFGEGDQS